jgi:uncharacterized protein with PQ loop repeat
LQKDALQTNYARFVMDLAITSLLAAAATVYGIVGGLSVLLQAGQMRARGSSGDISLRFLATYVGGYAIWLLYGLSTASIPIVAVNAVGLVSGAVTLSVALKLRCPPARPAC